MKLTIVKNAALILGLLALTACPNNERRSTLATPQGGATPPVGAGQPPTGNANGSLNLNMRSIQCDLEARRTKDGKFFTSSKSIPKTMAIFTIDPRIDQTIKLQTKFLGLFDIGKFGKTYLKFVPAAVNGSDTLILVNEGLGVNGRQVSMKQAGFAGSEVKLEAYAEGLFMSLTCKGTSQFSTKTSQTAKTNLVCSGKSNTIGSENENVEVVLPMASLTSGEEFTISNAVTGKLSNNGSVITYTATLDSDYGPRVTSSSSLNALSNIKISDDVASIDISCKIQ